MTHNGVIEIRGRVGRPNGVGETWLGWSELGEDLQVAGIYQQRKTKRGKFFVKMKHCHPANPKTVEQQANRNKMKLAVEAWQALTEIQKKSWRAKKYPRHMAGYNRFLRHFLKTL